MVKIVAMSLNILSSDQSPSNLETGILILPITDKKEVFSGLSLAAKKKTRKRINQLKFSGEQGEVEFLPEGSKEAMILALVGVGNLSKELDYREVFVLKERVRRAVGRVVQEARKLGIKEMVMDLKKVGDEMGRKSEKLLNELVEAVVDGVVLANYNYDEHSERIRTELKKKALRRFVFLVNKEYLSKTRWVIKERKQLLEGVRLTRDLVNRPAEDVRPKTLADEARGIAQADKNISCSVYDREKARKEGFGAFLSVARGSDEEPYVIHLKYRPKRGQKKKVFIVGKGITFDSGGLSIKPSEGMESMKTDMAGAATVLGLFKVLTASGCQIEVDGVIAACENMPGSKAYRPGDVVKARNGKTIEVLNTDAEGRITLADALSYSVDQEPDAIIDLATLTGACIVGLGETYAGLWANSDSLKESILEAASRQGEGLVAMPMPDEYKAMIDSRVADVRNIAVTKMGRAITAALFLKEFVGDTSWAHLDIAGPAYLDKDLLSYYSPGATGYGVRTIIDFLVNYN